MNKIHPAVWLVARIFLGFVFAYAGFSKLIEPIENFRGAVAQYGVVPYSVIPVVAMVMPWVELIFGVFLILGYAPRISALALTLMSLAFLIVLGSSNILTQGGSITCGCFGEGGLQLTMKQIFILDIVDTVIGVCLITVKSHWLSLDGWLRKS